MASLDLASAVLAALPGDVLPLSGAPDGWEDTAAELRAALVPAHAAPTVLADHVLAALDNLDAPAGWDETAEALRAALTDAAAVSALEVWPNLVAALDAQPNGSAPARWSETAAELQAALAPTGEVDVAPAVMEAVSGRGALRVVNGGGSAGEDVPARRSGRSRTTTTFAVVLGLAAAALLTVWVRQGSTEVPAPPPGLASLTAPPTADAVRPLAARNDATVEDLTTAGTVTAQVMQFEEGGPTIIFVNEVES